jgi:hypothetical protein
MDDWSDTVAESTRISDTDAAVIVLMLAGHDHQHHATRLAS